MDLPNNTNSTTPAPQVTDPVKTTAPSLPANQSAFMEASSTPPPPPPSSHGSLPKKKIAAIFGIIVLVAGVFAGIVLVSQRQLFEQKAWDCGKYTFLVSQSGAVSAKNDSTRDEPLQKAQVYINNSLVSTFDVPALKMGASASLGNVNVPNETFTWLVKGTSDCSNSGRYEISSISYRCVSIKAYDTSWKELSSTDLSKLTAGDKVRFVVAGSGSAANYLAAMLTINGTTQAETVLKKPTTNEFYQEYTVPSGVKTFKITAVVKGKDNNWY